MNEADWVEVFKRLEPTRHAPDVLALPHWDEAHWGKLLARTTPRHFRASEVVIQRGAAADSHGWVMHRGCRRSPLRWWHGSCPRPIGR